VTWCAHRFRRGRNRWTGAAPASIGAAKSGRSSKTCAAAQTDQTLEDRTA
jgi:hypothetical protein